MYRVGIMGLKWILGLSLGLGVVLDPMLKDISDDAGLELLNII